MDIVPNLSRSRSRSRTRPTARSNSQRRPSLGSRRSISSSSLTKLQIVPTAVDNVEAPVPSAQATLDNTLPLDFFKQDILVLVKALKIHKWWKKPLEAKHIGVNRISGALTNSIYKIDYLDPEGRFNIPSLLLRVYGKNVDDIIDRDSELEVLIKLSLKHIGPKLLGIFTNGRFEQFLDGFVTLTKEDIRNGVISQMLGRRMKDLHFKIQLDYKDYKDNLPMCWKLIGKWLTIYEDELRANFKENGIKDEDIFLMPYNDFKKNIFHYKDWLFSKYQPDEFASNFKFCHNDTQYGNLLLHNSFNPEEIIVSKNNSLVSTTNRKDNSLVVIDFEYGGPNFPAFDLANHFSEWMANYHDPEKSYFLDEKRFPSQLEQINLLKAYVEYDFKYPSSNLIIDQPDLNKVSAADLIQYEIKKLYNESVLWRASVQIYWAIWGLIQNGPVKAADPVEQLASTLEGQGVDGTYTITTGLTTIEISESAIDDEITSADDDFNYIKYSQQKAALALGDLISLNLVDKESIAQEYQSLLKFLDCSFI